MTHRDVTRILHQCKFKPKGTAINEMRFCLAKGHQYYRLQAKIALAEIEECTDDGMLKAGLIDAIRFLAIAIHELEEPS